MNWARWFFPSIQETIDTLEQTIRLQTCAAIIDARMLDKALKEKGEVTEALRELLDLFELRLVPNRELTISQRDALARAIRVLGK